MFVLMEEMRLPLAHLLDRFSILCACVRSDVAVVFNGVQHGIRSDVQAYGRALSRHVRDEFFVGRMAADDCRCVIGLYFA